MMNKDLAKMFNRLTGMVSKDENRNHLAEEYILLNELIKKKSPVISTFLSAVQVNALEHREMLKLLVEDYYDYLEGCDKGELDFYTTYHGCLSKMLEALIKYQDSLND